ncbi:PIN domain-containing protein [Burkholderia anthina]|uniref:PIN domain-containing protein n=1 Tax=Burkholderia anthina TaxID=179879 RepID=UPI003C797D1F
MRGGDTGPNRDSRPRDCQRTGGCGAEKVLAYSPTVFIAASASGILDNLTAEEEGNKSIANMAGQDGRIVLREFDDTYHERRHAYLLRLRDCVEKYSQVVPVYCVDDPRPALLASREVIDGCPYATEHGPRPKWTFTFLQETV